MSGSAVIDEVIPDLQHESPQVHEVLSALGRLLGAAVSRPAQNLTSFISGHLRVEPTQSASVSALLRGVDAPLVHVAVGRLLAQATDAVLADDLGYGAPGYELVLVDVDEQVPAPDDLAAFLPAGAPFDFDSVVVLSWSNGSQRIALYVRRPDHQRARTALRELLTRARGVENFYRGKTLRVVADDRGVGFTPIERADAHRDALVLPPAVWAEVDANVHGLVEHGAALAAAGLGASRGMLVVGAPGVGKTALCRVIARELPPGTTILLVDATVTARGLGLLYESLAPLAPAAVFLDDIDLLAGDRRSGTAGSALRELLTHLDGFAPAAPVLTVATTNDLTAIDPALLRAGRIDSVIEVGLPDRAARCQILHRLLDSFGDVRVDRIGDRTDGASGAELREIVRRTVLEHGSVITEHDVLQVVTTGRWRPAPATGHYL